MVIGASVVDGTYRLPVEVVAGSGPLYSPASPVHRVQNCFAQPPSRPALPLSHANPIIHVCTYIACFNFLTVRVGASD